MKSRLLQPDSLRRFALCGAAIHVSLFCGCQVGRRWFQFDSNSNSPLMGVELRADAAGDDANPDHAAVPVTNDVLPVEHIEPEPRRGLRDWLRFPRGEDQIPLPLTPLPDEQAEPPSVGPRPEFE